MAAKRTPKKKKAPVTPDADLPKLTQEELLRLRLADAEAKLAVQEARTVALELSVLRKQLDPDGRMLACEQAISQANERGAAARATYTACIAAASKRLGFDLAQGCTLDPETGTIIQHQKKE